MDIKSYEENFDSPMGLRVRGIWGIYLMMYSQERLEQLAANRHCAVTVDKMIVL